MNVSRSDFLQKSDEGGRGKGIRPLGWELRGSGLKPSESAFNIKLQALATADLISVTASKAGIQNRSWMPDRVRHDGIA